MKLEHQKILFKKLAKEASAKKARNKFDPTNMENILIAFSESKYLTSLGLYANGGGLRYGEYIRRLRREIGIDVCCQRVKEKGEKKDFAVYWLPCKDKEPKLTKNYIKMGGVLV